MDPNFSLPTRGGLSKLGGACGRGSVGMLALSLPVLQLCCACTEEAAGLPGQPFSRALNSHYRREVNNRKNHEFIEK